MTTFLIGTSGWNYATWRGKFYPKNLPQNQWLTFYANEFNALEINATFYRSFTNNAYQHWYANVPANFHYALKAPRSITHSHYQQLKNCQTIIQTFDLSAHTLKDKFGMILLQMPATLPYNPELLKNIIQQFSQPEKLTIEFRHQQWLTPEVMQLLSAAKSTCCLMDSPKMHYLEQLTSRTAYIRLHGSKEWYKSSYTPSELKTIAAKIKKLEDSGAEKIYIFFNNTFYADAIPNAQLLRKLLI